MQAYLYKCLKCGEKFEPHSTVLNDDKVDCPSCGSSKTVLVITPSCSGGRAGQFCSKSAGWKYT